MTPLKIGMKVINLDTVTEVLLKPPKAHAIRPGTPVRVSFIGGKDLEFAGEEADELREYFLRACAPRAPRLESVELVEAVSMSPYGHIGDLETDLA